MNFHSNEIKDVMEKLGLKDQNGITNAQANKLLQKYGKNEIKDSKKQGVLIKFLAQFKDILIVILLISAGVSLFASVVSGENEYYDFIIILTIVLCNAIIGTIQECKAEKAIEALKDISSPTATVFRSGKKTTIDSRDLVIGDIVLVKTGDIVPADIRLIQSVELSCDESSLTGESIATEKTHLAIFAVNAPISERKNMLFSGCGVSSGHGKGIVVNTGMNTEIGKIATMLQSESSPETPLQKKLNKTGKVLGLAVILICVAIFVLGLFKNIEILEMIMISISLAVAAIPEGLTAVVTIVLSMGVKSMANKKAIVRKLPAVEALGAVNVICSDKTGTLTQNKMTVVAVTNSKEILKEDDEQRKLILGLASLCNNAEITKEKKSFGMPTEVAIIKASAKIREEMLKALPRVGEIPFTSTRKIMTTVHKNQDNYTVITKGAPDFILKLCKYILINGRIVPLNTNHIKEIEKLNSSMAKNALRVLAVAKKEIADINVSDKELEKDLCYCGLIGIEDPPRKEAKRAVELCKKAGITAVMITGDQTDTALAVAKRVGIYEDKYKFMTGAQLSEITTEELSKKLDEYRVFSRVSPEDKVKIVRAFQIRGDLIAMTGDGINDAPALKVADIGCAMGKNGTEVAKSVADMILIDDNFATIVEAVKEGRGIYSNIRKTVHFLLSCNTGEILLILLAFLLGLPVPLLATQILWVNLVTDSFPALALGAGRADDKIMEGAFQEGNKDILSKDMCYSMLLEGGFIGIISLIAFIIGRGIFDTDITNPIIGRTMCFAVLCLSQLIHSFNISNTFSLFSSSRIRNKWLNYSFLLCFILLVAVIAIPSLNLAFKTVNLSVFQWNIVIILSLIPLIVCEIEKFMDKIFSKMKK